MSSPDVAMVLFVVAFVLLTDLLCLVEVEVNVAWGVVQAVSNLRHAQPIALLQHDSLGELWVLCSDGFDCFGYGHPVFNAHEARIDLGYIAHGVNVLIPTQVRQLIVAALRVRAIGAAVLFRTGNQRLQLAGYHAAAFTVFGTVLGAQLITEGTVGLLIAGRQVYDQALRAGVPGMHWSQVSPIA